MLLHGVLKCYVLYFLFVFCATATVKHQRVSNIDNRIRSLRRSLETLDDQIEKADNDLESDQPDVKDDMNNDNDGNDEDDNQQSGFESDKISKDRAGKESTESKNIKEPAIGETAEEVIPRQDLTDSSADKILEINKLSAMSGFDYSPAEVEKFKIWPQGIIPFYIDEFSYDKILRDNIREYLDEANSMTGLRFLELPRPPTDDSTRWVFIINRRGQLECADYTPKSFTNTGVQKLVIGYDCLGDPQYIAPIVLALAGVPPQHNSPDRDKYITVSMKSIQPDKFEQFTAVKPEDWLFHDIKYDFLSAGHYPVHKYTTDGSATIVPKKKINTFIGEVDGLSYADVLKIRILYNFIVEKDDKNAKLPDCKALYRPGPNFKMVDTLVQHSIPARKKPKEYILAARNAGIEIVEGSENTPSALENEKKDAKNKQDKNDDEGSRNNSKHDNNDENNNNPNDNNDENADNLNENNDGENAEKSSRENLKDKKSTTSTSNPMNWDDKVISSE